MTNPYETPQWKDEPQGQPFQSQPPYARSTMVNQVRVVAILMIAQGVLECIMGVFYALMSLFFPVMLNLDRSNSGGGPGRPIDADDEKMMWIFGGVYIVLGAGMLIVGILRIVAGARNYKFRSRILAIVSMVVGLGTSLTCYCAPTAIAVAVYGLIVYLNRDVVQAFEMRKQGAEPEQVIAAFTRF